MKTNIAIALIAILGWQIEAQIYDTNGDYVQTFAGSGFSGDVNGVGVQTMFNNPNAIVTDSHSNIFFWDSGNYKLKKITPDGTVTTFASIAIGIDVQAMAMDKNNSIWLLSSSHNFYTNLYQVTASAVVTRFDLTPFPVSNSNPIWSGLCLDSAGNIYLSSPWANRIYKYSTNGVMMVFAGSGNPGYADGNGIFTAFNFPTALAVNAANNIYVWDTGTFGGNYLIRKIDQSQNVTTFAGQAEPLTAADRHDLDYALKLLDRSKPECRDYLWNHFVIGFDYAEIAEEQNLNYDNVRMKIGRCLDEAKSLVA